MANSTTTSWLTSIFITIQSNAFFFLFYIENLTILTLPYSARHTTQHHLMTNFLSKQLQTIWPLVASNKRHIYLICLGSSDRLGRSAPREFTRTSRTHQVGSSLCLCFYSFWRSSGRISATHGVCLWCPVFAVKQQAPCFARRFRFSIQWNALP